MSDLENDEPGDEDSRPFYELAADEPWLRDRCLFPGSCIVADPYHDPEECWTAEHVGAYEAELGKGDA